MSQSLNKLTKAESKRLKELYEEALGRFTEKCDFYVSDWLYNGDAKEYERLNEKSFKGGA